MTTLEDRPGTALLVLDMQRGAVADGFDRDRIVANVATVVDRARRVGVETDECVRSTLHGALVRGYDTTLVSDAHTTGDHTAWGAPSPELVIAHTNLYWDQHQRDARP